MRGNRGLFFSRGEAAGVFAALLLGGCPYSEKCDSADSCAPVDTDTDTDTPTDTGADSDTDTDCDPETGLAQFYFLGSFETSAGEFVSAEAGYALYSLVREEPLCTLTGALPYEGEAPAGCPGCDWAFDLGGATGSVAEGEFCAGFGWEDGGLDGYLDYAWGYAPVYYYDYNGTPLPLESSLMLYYDGEWFPFGFNYGGRDWVEGDGESLSFLRPGFASGGGYAYYYYYNGDCG